MNQENVLSKYGLGSVKCRNFYHAVMDGMQELLCLDKSNPSYLANQLWRSGVDFIEPYREAIKERVVVMGNNYKGPVPGTAVTSVRLSKANKLMNNLCIVDERSRDLFLEVFQYALTKFFVDNRDLISEGVQNREFIVNALVAFFNKRPICMGIRSVSKTKVIQLCLPREGYSEGEQKGVCIDFPRIFFTFNRVLGKERKINTSMLMLFTSSIVDFFSMIEIRKTSVLKKASLKMNQVGMTVAELKAAEVRKVAEVSGIIQGFLDDQKAKRWKFAFEDVQMIETSDFSCYGISSPVGGAEKPSSPARAYTEGPAASSFYDDVGATQRPPYSGYSEVRKVTKTQRPPAGEYAEVAEAFRCVVREIDSSCDEEETSQRPPYGGYSEGRKVTKIQCPPYSGYSEVRKVTKTQRPPAGEYAEVAETFRATIREIDSSCNEGETTQTGPSGEYAKAKVTRVTKTRGGPSNQR